MGFDPWTLWTIIVIVAGLVAGSLLLAWAASPGERSLAYWAGGLAFFIIGILIGLDSAFIPSVLAVLFGNGAILAGYVMFLAALRSYGGRAFPWLIMIGVLAFWGGLCLLPSFPDMAEERLIILPLIAIGLLVLCIAELWRAPFPRQIGAWGLMIVITIMILVQLTRLALTPSFADGPRPVMLMTPLGIAFGLVALVSLFLASFLLVLAVRERSEAALRQAARRDELTGLPNRRDFHEQAALLCRQAGMLTMMLIDLDHFKQVNDGFGHSVGDQVLTAFGRVLLAGAPAGSAAGRLGGEEFAVLLVGLDLTAARQEAARVQDAFSQAGNQLRPNGTPLNCTASIGLAHVAPRLAVTGPAAERRLRNLLARADDVLYRAKGAGRNRIESIEISVADLDAG